MVVWYSHLLKNFQQFVVTHTIKVFSIVNEAKVDIFLEFSFLNPACTSVTFSVHVLFSSSWQNCNHNFASV